MLIKEFGGLEPRIQKDTAHKAISKHVKPERQLDCRIMIDNDLELFVLFLKATNQLLQNGVHHYGARSIVEHLRFHSAAHGKDVTFKINNNLPPLFARVALAMFDELYVMDTPFFECREALTTDQGRAA